MHNLKKIIEQSFDLKLLYVEDDIHARKTVLPILEILFKDITVAIDGVDGLEKFKINEIDLIITDINMPNMDGFEMSKEIKKIDRQIPMYIFSANHDESFFMKAIKIGVEGYLIKPIDMEQFTQTLYKSVVNINLKKENIEYRNFLEKRVKEQVDLLREKDKLLLQQSKMAAMGEIIDAVAHQWKQPLSIISLSNSLLCTITKDSEKIEYLEIKKCNNKVQKQVQHLSSTLDEFRNFFRPDMNYVNININKLFGSTLLLLKDELIQNIVQVEVICENDLYIKANENDIKHVLINLINNAKDEMVKNNISKRIIILHCYKLNQKITISVQDRGLGIPLDIKESIFKPNVTTKKDEGGTGIGLYICKLIADKYNATLNVSNNQGAVFKMTFPA